MVDDLTSVDYERIVERARRERSAALGDLIAGGCRACVRLLVGMLGLRVPHHRLPGA